MITMLHSGNELLLFIVRFLRCALILPSVPIECRRRQWLVLHVPLECRYYHDGTYIATVQGQTCKLSPSLIYSLD
jgi:hypothetical protein